MKENLVQVEGSLEALIGKVADEFLGRQERGEQPDVEEYAARNPEAAPILRKVLNSLRLLDLSGPQDSIEAESDLENVATGTLGDFRLVREIGRGGMGVVYEAEQISLRRRVALKVLPFAATMDPRQLQRFKNEAQAAAGLHHTNIVPVFYVGCERGVHFYAMQYIDGQSLAGAIAGLRAAGGPGVPRPPSEETLDAASARVQPSAAPDTAPVAAASTLPPLRDKAYFRRVAELGIQAAEALDHAHQLGIVHRDVKPGNLLVDNTGQLWITDFGLARMANSGSDAPGNLTMTGDLIGTLRYMSPEQALAKRVVVDHRTDIYSLGATLYELLTLEPVFQGSDRHELLRQIAFEEPKSPRRINRAIPAELETIVLKALDKTTDERYATAKKLAEDLQRFLEEKPVQARRPTLPHRLRKWSQRHRHLVKATAVILALVMVGLAVCAFLLWHEKEQTREALAEARANYAEAEAQRRRADTNFREAFHTIEHLLAPFQPQKSLGPLDVAKLRKYQTEESLRFLTAFCEQQSDDPAVRLQQGAAYVHTAMVYQIRAEQDKVQEAFQQAIAVFDRLVEEFPDDPTYFNELGLALSFLADHLYNGGRIQDANVYYGRALSVWREAVRKHPADFDSLRHLADSVCNPFDPKFRDPRGALELARKAVTLAPHLSRTWLALGRANYRSGEWHAAISALQAATRDNTAGNWTKAQFACFLAMAQWRCGRKAEAMVSYEQAVRLMETDFDALDLALLAEAADLLGIQEPLIHKAKKGTTPPKD